MTYREIQLVALTGIAMTAVLCDLRSGRIPNAVIATGLTYGLLYQLCVNGVIGLLLFLGGTLLPVLLLGVLFYFRMTGAGDIKLLCVVGGFLGPEDGFSCMVWAILAGAVVAVCLIRRRRCLEARVFYFLEYVSDYSTNRRWRPYLNGTDEKARFCFSIPVLIGILCWIFVR